MPINKEDLKEWENLMFWEQQIDTTSHAPNRLCYSCKHFRQSSKKTLRCTAYQDVIPPKIFYGKHDHHYPYPGDEGILYEPIEKTTPTNEY